MQNAQFLGKYNQSFNESWNSASCDDNCFSNAGIYFMQYAYYSDVDLYDTNAPYYAAIYNKIGANLNISNLYIGVGAHFSVLHNQGSASMHNLSTEFSQNGSAYYDRWKLRLSTMITNNFGTLSISNSDIVGADTSLIDIYGGTVQLYNVTLAQSMMGITTYYSAEKISIDNMNLYEIGKFYASFGAALYHHAAWSGWNWFSDWNWFRTPPCHLSADWVSVNNSKFSYLDSFGVLTFSEYGIYEPGKEDPQTKSLTFIGNQMVMNLVPDPEYEGYLYRTDFSALDKMLNESFGDEVKVDDVRQFIDTAREMMDNSTGLIVVENGYDFVIGNNDFSVDAELKGNDSEYAVDRYLYLNSGSVDGCIGGNKLTNFDILVKSGNIKSCKHHAFDANQVEW